MESTAHVDVVARRRIAGLLRGFIEGQLSNMELDRDYPGQSLDPAVHEVYRRTFRFQDDFREYRTTGQFALPDEQRDLLGRCALFMETELPYEWPLPLQSVASWFSSLFRRSPRGTVRRSRGERSAWPFFRQADLDAARGAPPAARGGD